MPIAIPTTHAAQKKHTAVSWTKVTPSPQSTSAKNMLRALTKALAEPRAPGCGCLINLGLGDPTHHPEFLAPAPEALAAFSKAALNPRAHGYTPSQGHPKTLEAIAKWHTKEDKKLYSQSDVILANGASGALEIVLSCLLDSTKNVLFPSPGFAAYESIMKPTGAEVRLYKLKSEQNWEADILDMTSKIDENTAAILICNPSNPCGSSWTVQHIQTIVDLAEKYKIPIIADEIYAHQTYAEHEFTALATLSTSVPVLTICGLAKRFLCPGWRLGWILIHDPLDVLSELKNSMLSWVTRAQAPNSVLQAALPDIFESVPRSFFTEVNDKLRHNAQLVYDLVSPIPGLSLSIPQGSMYSLINVDLTLFPEFPTTVDFTTAFLKETATFVMPGDAFWAPSTVRFVIANPPEILREAVERLKVFVEKHIVV